MRSSFNATLMVTKSFRICYFAFFDVGQQISTGNKCSLNYKFCILKCFINIEKSVPGYLIVQKRPLFNDGIA